MNDGKIKTSARMFAFTRGKYRHSCTILEAKHKIILLSLSHYSSQFLTRLFNKYRIALCPMNNYLHNLRRQLNLLKSISVFGPE
jgi:hypothetical protein